MGGKFAGDAIDEIVDVILVENLPEGGAVAQLLGRAAAEGNDPLANLEAVLRAFDLRGGKIKLKSFRVAVDEIEDAMATGIHARDQVRPGYGALRRDTGSEAPERAFGCEAGKVRHLAIGHKFREQVRVKAVDAENDHLLRTRGGPGRADTIGESRHTPRIARAGTRAEDVFPLIQSLFILVQPYVGGIEPAPGPRMPGEFRQARDGTARRACIYDSTRSSEYVKTGPHRVRVPFSGYLAASPSGREDGALERLPVLRSARLVLHLDA